MATRPVKIRQGNRHILLELHIPTTTNSNEITDDKLVGLTNKILKKWLFNVNRGREALTILIDNNQEDATIYDILKIVYENNSYLGKSFLEFSFKNYKVGIKIIFEGEEIHEFKNEIVDLNANNNESGLSKIWFNKNENCYIMVIKTDVGCEIISTMTSEFEDLNSTYNVSVGIIEDMVRNAVQSNVDISNKNFQNMLIETYKNIINKKSQQIKEVG